MWALSCEERRGHSPAESDVGTFLQRATFVLAKIVQYKWRHKSSQEQSWQLSCIGFGAKSLFLLTTYLPTPSPHPPPLFALTVRARPWCPNPVLNPSSPGLLRSAHLFACFQPRWPPTPQASTRHPQRAASRVTLLLVLFAFFCVELEELTRVHVEGPFFYANSKFCQPVGPVASLSSVILPPIKEWDGNGWYRAFMGISDAALA